ncbi:fumarylacetoacetate hydrolase family protein [Edaphobacter aggregans]|uniref:fumarylacetoacetate hydrolase family protein n=1 Tax=Edaphobacter aggregans TaxID=570835 RepID=UPI001FE12E1D|nr:fumarylacetoacetate hydrolase family protein [Edaphobacter aggregans]
MVRLYRTTDGFFGEERNRFWRVEAASWEDLLGDADLHNRVSAESQRAELLESLDGMTLLSPVSTQEVWAAGVTYFRSRSARIEESKDAGGGTFYDRVYAADRPELFFKASGRRVVGPLGEVRIRRDARWSVPEPELTLAIHSSGKILGYTIGNDMSSRDIEGENPLYLPQAKVYDGSCAIGPCLLLESGNLPKETAIGIKIERNGAHAYVGQTTLKELKRPVAELVSYLFRENSFPEGVFLMTGTGIVPHDDFTLVAGDRIVITIDNIGTLENQVASS